MDNIVYVIAQKMVVATKEGTKWEKEKGSLDKN